MVNKTNFALFFLGKNCVRFYSILIRIKTKSHPKQNNPVFLFPYFFLLQSIDKV